MTVRIENSFKPITEAELATFEQELDLELPNDYRQFLLVHNGGVPTPDLYDFKMDSFIYEGCVTRFLGLREGERYSFSRYLKTYQKRLPANLFPIALDLSVDLICVSTSGNDYGRVHFWDHNWEITDGKPDYSNVHFVANSFTEFLDMLYDDDEED